MNKNTILIIGLAAIGGLIFWNYQKIKDLQSKLDNYKTNPPQRNSSQWLLWIQLALDFMAKHNLNIEDLWKPGGPFYNVFGAPKQSDVKIYIEDNTFPDNTNDGN